MRYFVAYYDMNKNYISGANLHANEENKNPYITPINCYYMRITIEGDIENYVLNEGAIPNKWTPYFKLIDDLSYLDKKYVGYNINNTNLLNPNKVLFNYYDSTNGNVIPTSGQNKYFFTDFIPLEYENYISSNSYIFQIGEYDQNYKFIEKIFDINTRKYTPKNANTKYVRITIMNNDNELNKTTIVAGNYDTVEKIPYYVPQIPNNSIYFKMLNDDILNYIANLVNNISPLKNKNITFLGDSITYGYDGANSDSRVENPYPSIIQNNSGCISTNLGINGSTISGNRLLTTEAGVGYQAMNVRIKNIANSNLDYLIIFGGTNDWGSDAQVPLGTINDKENTTFYGSLINLIEYYYNNFTTTKLGFITPLRRSRTGTNNDNHSLDDYVNAIIEVCKMYSIPYLDLYHNGNCYPLIENWKTANLPDGLHPNQQYYYKLADKIHHFIENL